MYKYPLENLLSNPKTYQFSDVSSSSFIEDYLVQRSHFLDSLNCKNNDEFSLFLSRISLLEYEELLKLQKKFEVKKSFFNDYSKDASFIAFFSYQLSMFLKEEYCLSLFSTLLKVNDTLSSLSLNDFSFFERNLIFNSINIEIELIKDLLNE